MIDDPGARRHTLARRAQRKLAVDDATTRREQAQSLPMQGKMLRGSTPVADLVWATAISKLDSEDMKFALNSATDTLPHNSNLVRWYRGTLSDACKLCGQKQTLLHILNNCDVALKLRRYNRRHDQVVGLILAMAQEYLANTYKITADLEDNYTFPSHITPSNLRPDIVLWSDEACI